LGIPSGEISSPSGFHRVRGNDPEDLDIENIGSSRVGDGWLTSMRSFRIEQRLCFSDHVPLVVEVEM
jgi:hypothetical protein